MNRENIPIATNAKFLITGGAGFIGANLTEAILKLGYKVRVLDNFATGKRENLNNINKLPNFEFVEGDIRDILTCQKACKDIDYVLHQAALGSVPRSIKNPLMFNEVNITGTLNMLSAAKDNKIKKFVYASSSSVYGDDPRLPKQEGQEGNLLSPYAITKHVNELYAINFYKLFNVKTIGLRYFNVFGRLQNPDSIYAAVIPLLISKILHNESPTIYGDGNQSRDFTYIDNVIQANIKACLADDNANGKVFNIAYGGRETLNSLYKKLLILLEKDITPNYGPTRLGDIPHSNADITQAQKYLNYNPVIDLEHGLKLTVNWYKKILQ